MQRHQLARRTSSQTADESTAPCSPARPGCSWSPVRCPSGTARCRAPRVTARRLCFRPPSLHGPPRTTQTTTHCFLVATALTFSIRTCRGAPLPRRPLPTRRSTAVGTTTPTAPPPALAPAATPAAPFWSASVALIASIAAPRPCSTAPRRTCAVAWTAPTCSPAPACRARFAGATSTKSCRRSLPEAAPEALCVPAAAGVPCCPACRWFGSVRASARGVCVLREISTQRF